MDSRKELLCRAGQQLKPQDNTVLDFDKALCHIQAQSQLIAPAFENPVQKEQHGASQSPLYPVLLPLGEKAAATFPDRQEPAVQSDCHISLRILIPAILLEEEFILNDCAIATQPFNSDPTPGVPISPSPLRTRKGALTTNNRAFASRVHVPLTFKAAPSPPHSHSPKKARRDRKGWYERHGRPLARSQAPPTILNSDLVTATTIVVLPTCTMGKCLISSF
jgi:hypothetical protein